jgi:L-alanine-DL-glutamate epimerase-like enolase superfamily enzyme
VRDDSAEGRDPEAHVGECAGARCRGSAAAADRCEGAYNTNGLWLVPIEQVPQEAEELVDQCGFKAIKLRLGRPTLKEGLGSIAATRS